MNRNESTQNYQGFGEALSPQYQGAIAGQLGAQAQAFANCPTTGPKQREIPEKIARLFARSEMLEMRLQKFAARLECVSGPYMPREVANANQVAPVASRLGVQLNELYDRVDTMLCLIDQMDAQLEL